jgi:hypothetical protein
MVKQIILGFLMTWDLKSLDREIISTVALRKTEFSGILSLTMTVNRSFCFLSQKLN